MKLFGRVDAVDRRDSASPKGDLSVIGREAYRPRMKALAFAITMIAAAVGAALNPLPAQAGEPALAVVELFTSQGCSSCPPAEAFLGDLSKKGDILALEQHVDYWDYIGWQDPFASQAATQRQRAYAHAMGQHMVYTPQMVIDGRTETVGSHQPEVERLIAEAAARPKLPVQFRRGPDNDYFVEIGAGQNPSPAPATVWLVIFDREIETAIDRGENAGTSTVDYNVVREWRRIGTWAGRPMTLPLGLTEDMEAAYDGCAVIVQAGNIGPILGAAAFDMDD